MNQPARHELYVLDDGEKPVEVAEDTKIPNAATIKIVKQDHTLGNMLRAQLLSMPQVIFAGYKVPHPLHPYFEIKLQTDGTATPQEVLEQACTKLIGTLATLETKFKREFSYKDVESGGATTGAGGTAPGQPGGEDPYGTGAGASGGWGRGRDYLDF
ncbi:DNA-directed RNA polymerase [Crepidotus variabilis]|uniref:DNA-directed RNA polymerase n=1 Tax=Crepidotus variabilis TaxID=179855 RepID=A0A9P6JIR3_9AGAR|nr:DNA-directed RNA polymerase [Crepidotus variabilis]